MSGMNKLLVVEDEDDIRELIAFNLEMSNFEVLKAKSGEEAIQIAEKEIPDTIILDVMLPGIDGFEVCRYLKKNVSTKEIPVIMLTARSEDSDVVTGLELGADDYITKPFSPRILIARVHAAVRRRSETGETKTPRQIKVHDILIDFPRHEVYVKGENVNLSATEFAILKFLITNPGWVFSRSQIIDAVKGGNYPVTPRSVDVQILGLRKKLGNEGRFIETVRGVGYRLQAE
jgi:DNA-binding response OmpR family regulator